MKSKLHRGLTLIELLVTLGILAILTSLALPSFSSLFERWQTNKAISALETTLLYARSESIRRGGDLVLIRQTQNGTCNAATNTDWRCGWILTTAADKTTALKNSGEAFPQTVLTASTSGDEISLDRWGGMTLGAAGNNFSFTLYPAGKTTASGKNLCIVSGGIARQIAGNVNCNG